MIIKAAKICAFGAILALPFSTAVHAELIDNSISNKTTLLQSVPAPLQVATNTTSNASTPEKTTKELKKEAQIRAKQLAEDQAKAKLQKEQLARLEAEQRAKDQSQATAKAQELSRQNEKAAKLKAKEDAKAKREADKKARIDAQNKAIADAQAKEKADADARKKAKDDAKAKRNAEYQARLDAQKKAVADSEAKLKAEADARKQAKEAKAKAKAEAKAKREADYQAQLDAQKKQSDVGAAQTKNETKTQKIETIVVPKPVESKANVIAVPKPVVESIVKPAADSTTVAQQSLSAMEAYKAQQQAEAVQLSILNKDAQKASPLQTAISNVTTVAATGESALQKATSGLLVTPKNEKSAIRVKLFGFHATPEQKEKINARYAYATSSLTVMPEKIGNIKLRPRITLLNNKLEMFNTLGDKKAAEEFFSYHPRHSQIFASYVTRIMTLNNGNTGGVSLDKGFMSELTYNFAETPIPSAASMQKAQDQYLYITNRLSETDSIKFWNWINSVRDADKIDIPNWVVLANILSS